MLIIVPDKESIHNFNSTKWLIEDEDFSNNEAKTFLKDIFSYELSFNPSVKLAKFFVNADYEVLIRITYTTGNYQAYVKLFFLTNQEARSFLKIVKGDIEERARKMQKVVEGIDQPKESEKTPTKTTPPPEIRLPPR